MSARPRSVRRGCCGWILLLLPWAFCANAQDEGAGATGALDMRSGAPATPWVGEAVTVPLDAASSGLSIGVERPERSVVSGVVVMHPQSAGRGSPGAADSTAWQALGYDLVVVSQQGGSVSVPSLAVSFTTSPGLGKGGGSGGFATKPLRFELALPVETETSSAMVPSVDLAVSQLWAPVADGGDGASNLSGILMPIGAGKDSGESAAVGAEAQAHVSPAEAPYVAAVASDRPERAPGHRISMDDEAPGLNWMTRYPSLAAVAFLSPILAIAALYRFRDDLRAGWKQWRRRRQASGPA